MQAIEAGSRARGASHGYFAWMSALLLALTLWGFSDNLFSDVGQPSNRDAKFIVHGLCCLAWMALFALQAQLVRLRNVALHRRLGLCGAAVALGVVASTAYVFVQVWNGWDAMPAYLQANRLLLPSYGVFVCLALHRRRRADWHGRCLLVATLFMLEPVLSRAFDPLDPLLQGFTDEEVDAAWWVFFVATWNGLFASLAVHDWRTLRRIHPATRLGYGWFCAIWVLVLVF